MKKLSVILLALLCAVACGPKEDVLDYVNPNIGTVHSRWFVFTPAATPFGMAKLGASTNGTYGNNQGWEAVGYEDTHTSIDGFPCFHEFQVGGLALMPVTGEPVTQPGLLEDPAAGWRSSFDKADEVSQAGYYSVILKDYGVKAELTATERVGFQRFTFAGKEPGHILINVGTREGESGAVRDAWAKVEGTTVQGWIVTEPEYVKKYQTGATVSMYFYGELSKAPDAASAFHVGGERAAAVEVSGPGAVLSLDYDNPGTITVKLGLSFTSVENAKANLEAEAASLTFDAVRKQTQDKWRKALGKLEVEGGKEGDKVKF